MYSANNKDSLIGIYKNHPDKKERVRAAYALARNHYVFSKPDSAIFYAKYQLQISRELKLKKTECLSYQIFGIVSFMKGRMDESMQHFDTGLEIAKAAGDSENVVTFLSSKANVFYQTGHFSEAEKVHYQVLKIRRQMNDISGMATVFGNLGLIASDRGDLLRALKFCQQAIRLFSLIDEKRGLANAYSNLSVLRNKIGDQRKSIEAALISAKLRMLVNDVYGLSSTYSSLGNSYKALKMYDSATYYQKLAIEINTTLGNVTGLATAASNLGTILQDKKNYTESYNYYRQALDLYTQAKNTFGLCYAYSNLASVNFNLKNFDEAEKFAKQSIELCKSTKNFDAITAALQTMYAIEKRKGNSLLALKYYKEYIIALDSSEMKNKKDEFNRRNLQFEFGMKLAADSVKREELKKLKSAEIKKQNENIAFEKTTRWILFTGLSILILFLSLVVHRFYLARKQKRIIENQKLSLESAFDELHQRNKELTDSIHYAKRIQRSLLTGENLIVKYLHQTK